jgi:hypothetical protein
MALTLDGEPVAGDRVDPGLEVGLAAAEPPDATQHAEQRVVGKGSRIARLVTAGVRGHVGHVRRVETLERPGEPGLGVAQHLGELRTIVTAHAGRRGHRSCPPTRRIGDRRHSGRGRRFRGVVGAIGGGKSGEEWCHSGSR